MTFQTPTPARQLTHAEATAVLSSRGVASAHLVDAVLLAVAAFGDRAAADHGSTRRLRVLFSRIEPMRVNFALFQDEQRLQLLMYEFDPKTMAAPALHRTDAVGERAGTCALTRQLQPLMDVALARMESQVWARVLPEAAN